MKSCAICVCMSLLCIMAISSVTNGVLSVLLMVALIVGLSTHIFLKGVCFI